LVEDRPKDGYELAVTRMNLDATQQQKVRGWIEAGLQPADIQKRLADELGLRLTYMEVRFLLADLHLEPHDKERVSPAAGAALGNVPGPGPVGPENAGAIDNNKPDLGAGAEEDTGGGVSVTVDQVTRAGAVVSGQVTFSDGKSAQWYLDQMGRLGMVPAEKGYRPPQEDLMEFQAVLQNELAKLGF
jgi:hypothetical protein